MREREQALESEGVYVRVKFIEKLYVFEKSRKYCTLGQAHSFFNVDQTVAVQLFQLFLPFISRLRETNFN